MLQFEDICLADIEELARVFVETFNAEPWNDQWTCTLAEKRLHQMINVEDFCGLLVRDEGVLCGMILGCKEQYYDGVVVNVREFCVRNNLRGQGIGSKIFREFTERMAREGVTKMSLVTLRGAKTEHFYHKQGLESDDRQVVMTKEL